MEKSLIRSTQLSMKYGFFNLIQLLAWHAVAATSIYYFDLKQHPAWALALVVIFIIHQRVLSEWIHEASHLNFLPSRKLNDYFINILACVFFFKTIKEHRRHHFLHHDHNIFFNEDDLETTVYKVTTKKRFWLGLLQDLTGISGIKIFRIAKGKTKKGKTPVYKILVILLFHSTLILTSYHFNYILPLLVYYFVLGTSYPLMLRLRVYGQHAMFVGGNNYVIEDSNTSRSVNGNFFEKLFFSSDIMLHHHNHHKTPSKSFRELKKELEISDDLNLYSRSLWPILKGLYRHLPS